MRVAAAVAELVTDPALPGAVWRENSTGGEPAQIRADQTGNHYLEAVTMKGSDVIRIAAVADVHCPRTSPSVLEQMFRQLADEADVLILAGDVTDHGTADEAETLVHVLTASVRMPIVAVLGNHDFEHGTPDEVIDVLADGGVQVLDGDTCEIHGVGFAGAKGFGGGFGRWTLGAWGEPAVKSFVQDALDEAMKLETALSRLETVRRVAVLHYAPIRGTVVGEPEEIFPFLGSSRLEEPLRRYPVDLVVHGHAHLGAAEGATERGTPVYNVSMPVLQRAGIDDPPMRLIELPLAAAAEPS